VWRDVQFIAAIIVAPLVWGGLFFTLQPTPDFLWIFKDLRKFLTLVFIYPILEEMVFRGWLQGELYDWKKGKISWKNISIANVLCSIVFATAHLFHHSMLWAMMTFFPSLIFGYFRDRYKSIYPSIILHIFYNAGYYLLFVR
jgi:membrane protease YdiL (CAAX protease family)